MASAPRTNLTRLVQIRAVDESWPLYGVVETSPANQSSAIHRRHAALVDRSVLVALSAHVGDTITVGMADFVIETHPAVGEKLGRARCRNTALPRPATRGPAL